ncbi:MAG TPA: response regulator [Deltaproteobacteria bacterium]|nr:response regulator [Deltaproteobacteria bacterium]HOM29339.1 response regulator [Deltaproteobacteria bacterium]HPP80323.1 response regulator [Deltaproteobacteria bacterium]
MEGQTTRKWKILFADDNRELNDAMRQIFGEHGFDVVQAFDGDEAFEVYCSERPDLVFLDYLMPKMDGVDVLEEIMAVDPHALVVFITGEGSEDTAVQAMKAGAKDYVTKPFSIQYLIHIARKFIREHELVMENARLREKAESYRDSLVTITETMGEAVITIDAQGRIQFMNLMAKKLWGPSEEMQGKPVDVLVPDPNVNLYAEIKESTGAQEGHYQNEYTFRKADGGIFLGLLSASSLKGAGGMGDIVLVIRDLTDIEMMRRQVINAEKLASLGKVVEGVAHEIRNSLTSLGGFSRRLSRSVDENSAEKVYVDYIIEDVKRLESMILDIEEYVNYTKIHRPNYAPTHIEDVIENALIKTFGSGKFSQVTYTVNIAPGIEDIYADHDFLVEAFWHLFVNACESMDGKGTLKVDVTSHPNYVIVDVIDTGKGIPSSEIKEIFNPFYTSKARGAGLGLSKVYMIIEEHGGFITVNSVVNEGTRMRVFLSKRRGHGPVIPKGA